MAVCKRAVIALAIGLATPWMGCTTMTPAHVSVAAPRAEVLAKARRAFAEEGLQAALQDTEAGTLFSDWVVWGSSEDGTSVYRIVVMADGSGSQTAVTVRAEMQTCPPYSTVFDRCTPFPGKLVPNHVQAKLNAVSNRIGA